jgi:hypothetical protein
MKDNQDQGFNAGSLVKGALGFTDAPASAKRSRAANIAFDLSRREYKGKETTEEEMELKDDLRRAMNAYVTGDKSRVNKMLAEGVISKRQYDIAVTRYAILDNKKNPLYKDQLSQALARLTVKSALKVYEEMTPIEKKKHDSEITKKINNMMLKREASPVEIKRLRNKWNEIRA